MKFQLLTVRLINYHHWKETRQDENGKVCQNISTFYETRDSITVLLRIRHWSLYWSQFTQTIH